MTYAPTAWTPASPTCWISNQEDGYRLRIESADNLYFWSVTGPNGFYRHGNPNTLMQAMSAAVVVLTLARRAA